jgi:hypothetical protein
MSVTATYKLRVLLALPLLVMLSGCYDMTIQLAGLPGNTPPAESIYISGNFNNWDPGDPNYILHKNSDSVYEVKLPKGFGDVEYKFTRGDWSTVEKDPCGFEVPNRIAYYSRNPIRRDTVRSWADMPHPNCPGITVIIESLPENTPTNASLYFASTINNWDPGNRYWMFTRNLDGKYYIEIPRPTDEEIEYKITRGGWATVECAASGEDIDNRVFRGKAGEEVRIVIERWKDK